MKNFPLRVKPSFGTRPACARVRHFRIPLVKLLTPWLTLLALPLRSEEPAFTHRSVTLWSDGIRMAGDLYLPKGLRAGDKYPGIVFCQGTGGVKKTTAAQYGPRLAQEGFVMLAFDYRGYGDSDSKLAVADPQPKPDASGKITVTARPIRWHLDMADQTWDIRCAISFLAGEPGVDPARIGLIGTSYGGGLVTWVAGNDPRVKCVAVQVPGMGGGRGPAAVKYAYDLLTKQSRGETEPVPFETGKLGGKMASYDYVRANPAKGIGYNVFDAAAKITAPTLILVAENEELMKNEENGRRVYDILKEHKVPCDYQVLPGIGHYGVYKQALDSAFELELAWFKKHLGGP